jgi:hypothetical protein
MSDINLTIDKYVCESPSIDDTERMELPWENREEKILLQWCADCKIRSKQHNIKGKQSKIKFAVFSVPGILIPIVLGGISPIIQCNSIIYSLGMMASGLFSGVNVFFNFGKKQQEHFDYTNKFFELSNEITSELSKPKRFRISCDVYMERVKNKYNEICKMSPTL